MGMLAEEIFLEVPQAAGREAAERDGRSLEHFRRISLTITTLYLADVFDTSEVRKTGRQDKLGNLEESIPLRILDRYQM